MTWVLIITLTVSVAGKPLKLKDFKLKGGNTEQQCNARAAELQSWVIPEENATWIDADFRCEKRR
jgi:hypothetical protein